MEWRAREGVAPQDLVARACGYDIDPHAVAVAEAAINLWAIESGVTPQPLPGLQTGDGLLDELPKAAVVVGNPPFLNQLRSASSNRADRRRALRDRWGDLVGAYTDDAWLFLAAGAEAIEAGGSLAMVQPVSLLAAQHAEPIREAVQRSARLDGLWLSDGHVFDASVQVCGVIGAQDDEDLVTDEVRRWTGPDFVERPHGTRPNSETWGPLAAGGRGIPTPELKASGTLDALASATAGFRDQFYGFAPFVDEAEVDETDLRPLVTVGMIDPLALRWGEADFRFAKKSYRRPAVRIGDLRGADPTLAEWVRARSRPKVLVATQTRVIEAWVDETGSAIPATPVISVEPHDSDDVWLVAAALMAPPIAAHCLARKFGTAMSLDALKLAARDIEQLPLPTRRSTWERGAELARDVSTANGAERLDLVIRFGETMSEAYGVGSASLEWWRARLPQRSET